MWDMGGLLLVLMWGVIPLEARPPLSARLGGVFEKSDPGGQSEMFREVVEGISSHPDLLNSTRLHPYLQYAESQVAAYRMTCTLLEHSVMAVFSSMEDDSLVGAIASQHQVPHLSTEVVSVVERRLSPYSIYLAPSREDMTQAVLNTIQSLGVDEVALISNALTGRLQLSRLVEDLQATNIKVVVLELEEKDVRPDLVQIRQHGISTCIVDVAAHLVKTFIQQAMQAGLVHPESTFLFTTLDFVGLDLEIARHSGATYLGYALQDFDRVHSYLNQNGSAMVSRSYRAALLVDAVNLFSLGLQDLSELSDPTIPRLNCQEAGKVWQDGPALLASLQRATFQGLTGNIVLEGQARKELRLEIYSLTGRMDGPLAAWTSRIDGPLAAWTWDRRGSIIEGKLQERLWQLRHRGHHMLEVVLSGQEAVMEAKVEAVMDALRKRHKLGYKIVRMTQDGKPEVVQRGEGTGSMERIFSDDLATEERLLSRDFTLPYVSLELSVLTQNPDESVVGLLGSLLACLLVTSLALSLSSRLSPYQRSAALLTLWDSLWIVVCSLLLRSWNFRIMAASSRLILVSWLVVSLASLCHLLITSTSSAEDRDPLHSLVQVVTLSNLSQRIKASIDPVHQMLASRLEVREYDLAAAIARIRADPGSGLILPTHMAAEAGGCEFSIRNVGFLPLSFSLPKGSKWTERLNQILVQLPPDSHLTGSSNHPSSTSCFRNTQPTSIFYWCAVACILSSLLGLLLSLCELATFSYRQRRRSSGSWLRLCLAELKAAMRGREISTPSVPPSPVAAPLPSTGKVEVGEEDSVRERLLFRKVEEERIENSRL